MNVSLSPGQSFAFFPLCAITAFPAWLSLLSVHRGDGDQEGSGTACCPGLCFVVRFTKRRKDKNKDTAA